MFEGKTILVTGGTAGIGRAVTEALLAQGARVATLARTPASPPAGSRDGNHLALIADVADADGLASALASSPQDWQDWDGLVTCAGSLCTAPFLEMAPANFERDIAVNLGGVANAMRAVLPGMLSRGRGRIVNLASGAGERGWGGATAYAAAKAAVIALGQSVAEECRGSGVTVNTVSPGMVDTGLLRGVAGAGFVEGNAANILRPGEVAAMVLHLLSEASGRVNAQCFSLRNTARW